MIHNNYKMILILLTLCCMPLLHLNAASSSNKEYKVKAAFIYNFAKYVTWPESSFETQESKLVIGVVGKNPFGTALDKTLKGKKIHNREIQIKYFKKPQDITKTHILFVSNTEKGNVSKIASKVQGNSTLTISDMKNLINRSNFCIFSFINNKGMLGFIKEKNRVRFQIDLKAIRKENLKVSAKLLKLAQKVNK